MSTLKRGPFFVIRQFQASGYIVAARTELAFEKPSQVVSEYDDCRRALRGIEPSRYGILFDWRAPQMTTNGELHKSIVQHTDALAAPFARRALLVCTPVGQMQVARVGRVHSDGAPALFNDEAAAIAYVAWSTALGEPLRTR